MTPDQVRGLIAEVLGIDPARVHADLGYREVAEWDSLHHVELVLALEERLGVEIEAEQMVELRTVGAIQEFAVTHSGPVSDPPRASD